VELKLNGTHQLLAYADDVSPQGDNIDSTKINIETFFDAIKEVGLEISVEKTIYKLLACHQCASQNCVVEVSNRLSENVSQFQYLGIRVTNENFIQEQIKGILNSGNICYHSFKNLLSSCLLSKNAKIRIYRTIILPAGSIWV
jgi:hypothetical protein